MKKATEPTPGEIAELVARRIADEVVSRWPDGRPPESLLPLEGFIRKSVFLLVLPLSESELDRGIAEGRLPKPIKYSDRVALWDVADVRRALLAIRDMPRTAAQGGGA